MKIKNSEFSSSCDNLLKIRKVAKIQLLPKFFLQKKQKQYQSEFPLYELQKSWLNHNCIFKQLLNELKNFNKLLSTKCQQIPNRLKFYYLHKNLFNQLSDLNNLTNDIGQVDKLANKIKLWFYQERNKMQSQNGFNIAGFWRGLPVLPKCIGEDQDKLRRTMIDITKRRQYQVNQVMSKTSYSGYFTNDNKTIQYKQQKNQQTMSQTFSQSHNQSNISFQTPQKPSSIFRSKSVSAFQSTAANSQKQQSQKKLKLTKLKVNELNINKSLLTQKFRQSQFAKKSNFYLIDDLIYKDKQEKIIDQIEKINILEKKPIKPKEILTLNNKTSRLKFSINQSKVQFLNRKHFINHQVQTNKFNQNLSRFKTNQNRKLEFRRYLSNHQLNKNQYQKHTSSLKNSIGKKIIQLPHKMFNFDQSQTKVLENPQNQTINTNMQALTIISLKKKQFQQSLRNNSLKRTVNMYSKYFKNHLKPQDNSKNDKVDQQSNDQQKSIIHSSFTSINTSRLNKTKNSVTKYIQSQQKQPSLTSFRANSIKSGLFRDNKLTITKVLQSNSISKYNHLATDQVMKLKLKLSSIQYKKEFNQQTQVIQRIKHVDNAFVKANNIRNALSLHFKQQDLQLKSINMQLFNNPFFDVKKGKKKTKKTKPKH